MRSTLYFMLFYIITINFAVSFAADPEQHADKNQNPFAGAILGLIVALNVVSFTCIVLTLQNIREINNDSVEVSKSAMDSVQGCIRAGLGPTTRKALQVAAAGKTEFAKLQ